MRSSFAMSSVDRVSVIVAWLKRELGDLPVPEVGIVCGSGLAHLADTVTNKRLWSYENIPFFPRSTVEGHKGELVYGTMSGKPVLLMCGRFHFYEGYSPLDVAIPIRSMAALGIKVLVVTNAAGGVDPSYNVGDIMSVDDQVAVPGLAGFNPLVGHNDGRFGPRFPAMNEPYDKKFQALVRSAADRLGFGHKMRYNGVYVCVSGPSYETRHEVQFIRTLGGTAVGMSTVQEVVVAVHAGMKVVGFSCVTNKAMLPGEEQPAPTHAEVLEIAKEAEPMMQKLVATFVADVNTADISEPPAAKHFRENPMSAADLAAAERQAKGGAAQGKTAAAKQKAAAKKAPAKKRAPAKAPAMKKSAAVTMKSKKPKAAANKKAGRR